MKFSNAKFSEKINLTYFITNTVVQNNKLF